MTTTARGWFKSSYCNEEESACVEVSRRSDGIAVRDSTDPAGPALTFELDAWAAFVATVQTADL